MLCLSSTGEIVGTFSISNIVRGYFHSAYLGYEAFVPHQGKGHMRAGMELLLDHAFSELNLHRLEANVQPGNLSSIRLLERAGFTKEGYSKNYLNVGDKGWRDHERWAIINDDWEKYDS
jgi:ribosomal-protein-alanine N-acetyltransferase